MQVGYLAPLVAGVEYFSGREAGGGKRLALGRGRPLEISGLTETTSPGQSQQRITGLAKRVITEFLPEALWAQMVQAGVGCESPGGHGQREL